MNIQELIDYCNVLKESKNRIINCIDIDGIIDKIKQLDEQQKVTIPQFVADWIKYFKKCSGTLYGSTVPFSYYGRAIADDFEGDVTEALGWIRDNSEVYAQAWIFGYEVEEEKRYRIRLKGLKKGCNCLNHDIKKDEWNFMSKYEIGDYYTKHTRKQLEDAGFGWVFDCESMEVEEVKDEHTGTN